MAGHTPMLKVARLDVISSGARRRWTLDEKQRLVAGELRRAAAGVGDGAAKFNLQFAPLLCVNALCNGIGVFEVARNMGTSVRIIHEYYGKQATLGCVCNKAGGLSWHTICLLSGAGDFRAQF
jgi:hypothetical protein